MASTKPSVLEMHTTKWRLTNALTSGGPEVMKEQLLGFEIVHVCIGNSVPGVLYQKFSCRDGPSIL